MVQRWVMRLAAAASLSSFAAMASAAGSMKCNDYHPVWSDVTTVAPGDVGLPGVFYVGIVDSRQQLGAVLDESGKWVPYQGGLFPIAKRFPNGIPASLAHAYALPGTTTGEWAGWQIAVGYAVLTLEAQEQIRVRRQYLNQVKPDRVKAGTWRPEYDSDDQIKWALLHKFLIQKPSYRSSMVIPVLDCSPPWS